MNSQNDMAEKTSATACLRCAKRKVRCDRQTPCRACVRHKVECTYPQPQASAKRRKNDREYVLLNRLQHYEHLLREQGIDPNGLPGASNTVAPLEASQQGGLSPDRSQPPSQAATISEGTTQSVGSSKIVRGQGRSVFVENSLWSRLAEELPDTGDDFTDDSSGSSESEASDADFSLLLSGDLSSNTGPHQLCFGHLEYLWDIFVQNVDPLTKVVHVPTLKPAVEQAVNGDSAPSKALSALLAAICSVAVMSMNDFDCKRELRESRATLLPKYIGATKTALSHARFMETSSIQVLQALTLHLISIQEMSSPRAMWTLTGVAIRISKAMGLDRDGLHLGLSPFQTELRRRIWWFLKTYDHRYAELSGLQKFRDLTLGPESTGWPTNMDDAQLRPGLASLPTQPSDLTDASFIAVKYELVRFAAERIARFKERRNNPTDFDLQLAADVDGTTPNDLAEEIQELLETKYLRYCDPSKPLHLMTMLMARAAMNTIRFLAHHPRRWRERRQTPIHERHMVWSISIKLIEQLNILQSNPLLKPYAWYTTFVMQWHAFIHILDTLRAEPLIAESQKAWDLVARIYESNPTMILDMRKPIHAAVGRLCLKAYEARAVTPQHERTASTPVPDFITQLQIQQEVASRRRKGHKASSNSADRLQMLGQARSTAHDRASPSWDEPSRSSAPVRDDHGGMMSSHAQGGGTFADTQPSVVIDMLDGAHTRSYVQTSDNDLQMDLDLDLGEWNGFLDDKPTQSIPWEQWDAWLAVSGVADEQLSWT